MIDQSTVLQHVERMLGPDKANFVLDTLHVNCSAREGITIIHFLQQRMGVNGITVTMRDDHHFEFQSLE